ncbi:MAG: hypothetical protein IPJ65_11080 [Archangiaceae bacterium]|nr:hypothetical protein [Archangiaceae bacterium]
MNVIALILALCNTSDPLNVENDCDLDGCKVGQGDCADQNPNFPNPPTNGNEQIRGIGCPNGAVAEVCDGKDNDCRNGADDGNPGGGMACTTGLMGVCGPGTTQCSGGMSRCNQNVMSSAETCDNKDNNCNGQVDENLTQVCYTGPAGSFTGACPGPNCVPRGVCKGVVQSCSAGAFPTCNGATAGQTFPSTETCNNLDDDCNGAVDNGNPGGGTSCSTGQLGICAAGTLTCQAGSVSCVRTQGPTTETCNGLDDNCDGNVDEGVTRTCFAGPAGTFTGSCPGPNCVPRGVCVGVSQSCSAGAFPTCDATTAGQTLPGAETCNNRDDDCNGTVDNGNPGGGTSCNTGQLGICAPGTNTCQAGVINCVRNVANPGTETCNNLDDDCDGMIDDGVNRVCYAGPAGSFTGTCPGPNCVPRGVCMGVSQSCSAGNFPTCDNTTAGQVFPGAEVCDGLDNDCNGTVDNGLGGGQCVVPGGVGRCAMGNNQCRSGGTMCVPNTPITETCNGVDDNCNGAIDEGADGGALRQLCFTGPAGTFAGGCPGPSCAPRGICRPDVQFCNAGSFDNPTCQNQVLPTSTPPSAAETMCNSLDDDCDGTVDDGNPGGGGMCNAQAQGVCAFGSLNCTSGAITCTPGAPQVEQCNTIDENCNGQPNDIPARKCFVGPNVTPVTYTGTCPGPTCAPKGACTAGLQTCDLSGNFTACVAVDGGLVRTPSNPPDQDELLCNGIDDDCDGVVDDGNFDKDGDGVRVCAGDCNDDADGGAKQRPGLVDVCDGIDNDCNGQIDGMNTPCYSGPPNTVFADGGGVGQCRAGVGVCENGMPKAGTCMGEVLPGTEGTVCDRVDNDCDGKVDEDFDLDQDGVASCVLCPLITPCDCDDNPDGGQFVKPGARELCDCQDNNCGGGIDEGNVCQAAPCHDFDFDRVTNCQGDCDDRNPLVGPNRSERRSNGIDDDCDGQIDEDTDEDGDNYSVSQGDCDDKFAAVNPGAPERCDGFDNNCDGRVDEGFDQDGDNATTCAGDCNDHDPNISPFKLEACGNAVDENCDGVAEMGGADEDSDGVTTCENDCNDHNSGVHGAVASKSITAAMEICDGQDNDCDGQADEGFDQDNDGVPVCFGDCDDMDPTRSPLLYEVPTAMGGTPKDENCNGQIDEGAADKDMDGFTGFCGDCNDSDRSINPHGSEVCDRVDNNCDGLVDALPGNATLCAACFDNDMDGQTNCDGDCDDTDPAVYRGAPEVCDGKLNACGSSVGVDLDENGFRVCRDDAGFVSDAGTQDAGSGGGGGTDDAGSAGGGIDRPVVINDCGCGSSGTTTGPALFLGALLFLIAQRRQRLARQREGVDVDVDGRVSSRAITRIGPLLGLVALTTLTTGCPSSLTHPEIPTPDSGTTDAGTDAGFKPPVDDWNCPGLYPTEQLPVLVPRTLNPFAIAPRFTRTEVPAADALLFDDGAADVAGFVLRRDIPMDVDPSMPAMALDTIAVREVLGLDALPGTPLVRDRTERTTRTFVGPTYTTSQNLVFANATNAFSVRNRLLAGLSGVSLSGLGALPQVAGAAAEDKMLVNVMFRINGNNLFISAAVSPLSKVTQNLPVVLDLTNGSALGDPNAQLQYRCEHRTAPALKSDFIFVVDNSGSMSEEQAALVSASAALYGAFASAGLDFRLGVVTTDSDVLRGAGFTRDLAQFQSDVKVGINGNGFEMGLEYALRAVKLARQTSQPPERQLREDAGLVIVILSDEENSGLKSVAQYAQDFVAEKAVIFAIVGPKPIGCSRVGLGRANAGSEYIDAATATGGSSGSICNPNLLEIVEEVVVGSLGAASKSPLVQRPISNSLAVQTSMFVPRSRTMGFDYDPGGNTILFFGSVPPEGTMFDAAYSYFAVIQ